MALIKVCRERAFSRFVGTRKALLQMSALTLMRRTYRLYSESVEIRDLESRGPWAVAAKRSEDATKGLRLSKSRISIGRAV